MTNAVDFQKKFTVKRRHRQKPHNLSSGTKLNWGKCSLTERFAMSFDYLTKLKTEPDLLKRPSEYR